MQTKQQIRQLLAPAGIRPKKRLGQHFLIDLNLMRLLIDSAQITAEDIVLEVGCGTGSLTEALAEKAAAVVAIEVDNQLAEIARTELAQVRNVRVTSTDILESKTTLNKDVARVLDNCREEHRGRLLLVANLPYDVACPVVVNLVTGAVTADAMYVTVQKEVAERMTAQPGSRDYGSVSILLAATGAVKIIRILKPAVFWPQPQVDSAMVSFVREESKAGRVRTMDIFSEVVHLFMSHRRKMLKSCVRFAKGRLVEMRDWPRVFDAASVDPRNRPDRLSPEDYVTIANICSVQLNPNGG
jgi:16S rRNA (adenine1518-N6/adenine1519-N6)-dimethyltransferase